jgi:NAD(P)H-hydrate epimerase
MRLVTAEEMRTLDRHTIGTGHATGETLMERAGGAVVAAMERRYGVLLAMRVLVLCGRGNNGGDGFVAARHLSARGADVRVALLGRRDAIRGDALAHLARCEAAGVAVDACDDETALARVTGLRDAWDFALDAVLGTGARGAPEGLEAAAVETLRALDDAGTHVVAVDQPTGVDADTGAIARRAVRADFTVTFGCPKRGQLLYPGRAFVGALEVADIGLADPGGDAPRTELALSESIAVLIPVREPRTHKGRAGRVLLVGGSPGLTGAVTLAARAATRSGAGYVLAAVPARVHDILEVKLTEEMTLSCAAGEDGTLSAAALDRVLEHAATAQAIALGPGLSRAPQAGAFACRVAAATDRPLVIDADGLWAIESDVALLTRRSAPTVLTPHLVEMSRLTGTDVATLEATRIDAARTWARTWNAIVVLKGAPTVTAAPDGRATVNPTGNPGMATAGMGDLLAGAIAALIAQGIDAYDAARAAVFAHGLAGDRCAAALGQLGMGASDVLEALPVAWRELEQRRDLEIERRGQASKHERPASGDAGRDAALTRVL